ncbi:PREDICTED: LOW QUALITY PROTEIN: uncharacterized protein LOC109472390 [Paramuricea clavata]|uniref:PREDICTED: LOW QUALITY PROTEIN: uncharacterized protein LOC109472390 n=1 Tax=Paramuricea clavata TaxID=317549 RepID=A0A6S7K0Q8_PARCT|nr:PREDICTED: LOW QUALITY PROTEIN: uncharacterized protein LOC109472390 [Paramuricea clavata]
MSRATLLHGHQGLLDEYNERVAEKLNTKSSSTEGTLSRTVGFIRGIHQMMIDIVDYNPYDSYLGSHLTVGGLFHAKKEFYRLISLLLSDLGLIFDIRSPSPWQIISELHTRGIFGESESESVKVCLSIANEIRLKTYFASNKQTELLSPIPQYVNATEQFADVPIFRYFHEHILVHLLSISCDMHKRCQKFSRKYLKQDEIDASIFESPFAPSSNATQMGLLYYRLQSSSKALEWLASESKDSSYYPNSLYSLGVIYYGNGEFKKSAECFQQALDAHYTNEDMSSLNVVACFYNLAIVLKELRQYEMSRHRLMQAISKHDEVYGERSQTLILGLIMHGLGLLDAFFGDFTSCIEVYQKVEQLYNRLGCVPDIYVLYLNLNMAQVLSKLDQYEQSIEYIKRAMDLSHQVFGEHSVNSHLAQTYAIAATVYELGNFNDEALSFFKRSLELFQIMFPENANLVPDPLPCLTHMDNLESALEYARTLYRGKPHIMLAKILYNLAWAFYSEKSLEYFREAKEIMDLILGPNHAHLITLDILNGMGTIYKDVCGNFAKAHHCFEDALSMNSVIYGEYSANDETAKIYDNIASAAEKIGNVSQAKEYYTEAVKIWEKIPITKMTCERFVLSLYSLSALCEAHGEQDEAFKYLAEAREVAKDGGCKNWKVVIILVYLYFEYIKMESFESFETSVMCCLEAREMAMNLPKNYSVPSWLIEFLHIS